MLFSVLVDEFWMWECYCCCLYV